MNEKIRRSVFYQIYPNSFMDRNGDGYGDFKGITEKLDYVASLGVDGIWLSPCFESPFCDGGYDVTDYFRPSARFGTMEEMDRMLARAHELGLKVLLDLVAGHTSDQNEMFRRSCEPERNEYSDMFIWTNDAWKTYPEYRFEYGRAQRYGAFMVNFFSIQPALNYGFKNITHAEWQLSYKNRECIKTREWLISVIKFWLGKGYDGFRVDMADSLVKNDDDKSATIEVWQHIFSVVRAEYPDAVFVSEWSDPEKSFKAGFDADFYLDHRDNGYYHLCRRIVEGKNESFFNPEGKGDAAAFMYDYLNRYLPTKNEGRISFITGNHDIYRTAEYFDAEQIKLIYGVLLTMPGLPFIYYGDEIGLACKWKVEPKEGGFQRTGTRIPMQWTRGKNCGFSTADADKLFLPVDMGVDPVNVEEQERDENSLLNFVRKVIALRKQNEDFCGTDFEVVFCESGRFPLIYKRGRFTVVVNPTLYAQRAYVKVSGEEVISVGGGVEVKDNEISVMPQTLVIFGE